MVIYKLINKLHNTLNGSINKNYLTIATTKLSNELLEILKVIGNCTICKDKRIDGNNLDKLHKSVSKIEEYLAKLEKEDQEKRNITGKLNCELFGINIILNKILCKGCCKEKEIKKLTDKCGNREIARSLYECKLNKMYYDHWIPFDEFKNIKYLAKSSFEGVHKATWIKGYYNYKEDVMLKRIYKSNDKLIDILKEVKLLLMLTSMLIHCP